MIKKVGNKWVVYGKDGGKRLGTHDTKEKALKQLRAIEMSKHMRSELKKMVREILSEAETGAIGGYDFGKTMGDSANIHMYTGYPRAYTVIGRAFFNRDDGGGHSQLFTDAVNALISLGYKSNLAKKACTELEQRDELEGELESVIKKALKQLMA